MSLKSILTTVDNDAKGFFAKLSADVQKAKQVWTLVSSPQTRALALKITADAITTVKDAEAAAQAAGLNFALDSAVVADIKTLIADAKAGDGVVVSDLAVLGITL
jgi:hypothetical protein